MTTADGVSFHLLRCHRRKRIALQVKHNNIIVKAPYIVPLQYIEDLVMLKKQWIENVQSRQQQVQKYQNQLSSNGQVWFGGNLMPLIVNQGKKSHVTNERDKIIVTLSTRITSTKIAESTQIKKQLERWLKSRAEKLLTAKVSLLSQRVNLSPKSISIRQYKARWGCCDNRGQIKLNYLLLMLPDWVIDYVIVHELCHLKFLNHSADFWNLVESFLPDYQRAKQWLNEHQHYLTWAEYETT